MSLNRHAAARDDNELEIIKSFERHRWHCVKRSFAGGWDLDGYPPKQPSQRVRGVATCLFHVDVKMPTGKVTPAQVKKWTALRAKGIPVYVVRTAEDVDALVRGELAAWVPWENEVRGMEREAKRGKALATATADAGHRFSVVREPGKGQKRVKRSVAAICDGGCGKRLWTKAKGIVKASVLCDDCRAVRPKEPPVASGRRSTSVEEDDAAFDAEVKRRLGLKAAKEAEETFAPPCCDTLGRVGEHHWSCANAPPLQRPLVPPCPDCGEAYDPTCHDREAPSGAVSCRKDVHCRHWDGHPGDCQSHSARACTT